MKLSRFLPRVAIIGCRNLVLLALLQLLYPPAELFAAPAQKDGKRKPVPVSASKVNSKPKENSTESVGSKISTPDTSKPNKDGGIGGSLQEMFGGNSSGKGGPLYVKSDSLELNSKDRVFTYKGHVELVRDDVKITAKLVEGKYSTDNRLETVLCNGDVVITKADGMKATANRGIYRVAAAVMELTEGPELYRDGNVLAADKVTVYLNEDRSEAEGNVRVKVIKPNDTSNSTR